MFISDTAIKRPIQTVVAMLGLVVFGIAALSARGVRLELAAEPGVHRIDLAAVRGEIASVKVDGRERKARFDASGWCAVSVRLGKVAEVEVRFSSWRKKESGS